MMSGTLEELRVLSTRIQELTVAVVEEVLVIVLVVVVTVVVASVVVEVLVAVVVAGHW